MSKIIYQLYSQTYNKVNLKTIFIKANKYKI
jgi:hypothetical protein